MSKILDWIKKHKVATALIILSAFFLPLIFVHIAYRISAVTPWFSSTWNSGDLLTYIAGFEAFLGTVMLSVVAIKQNRRLLDIEKERDEVARRPFIMLSNVFLETSTIAEIYKQEKIYYFTMSLIPSSNDENGVCCIKICLENTTNQYIVFQFLQLNLFSGFNSKIEKHYDPLMGITDSIEQRIAPSESRIITFILTNKELAELSTCYYDLTLSLRNTLGEHYAEKITFLSCGNEVNLFSFHNTEYTIIKT